MPGPQNPHRFESCTLRLLDGTRIVGFPYLLVKGVTENRLYMVVKEITAMNNLKEKAQLLRREKGLTASEIAAVLKKPTSTIGRWIRGIELTEDQQLALVERMPSYKYGKFAAKFYSENCKYIRETARENGRKLLIADNLSQREWLLVGISLYWGEGGKTERNSLNFGNNDANMIRTYIRFLENGLGVKKSELKFSINCYTDLESQENIEKYWSKATGLSPSQMTKSVVNNYPTSSKKSRKKLSRYGTCRVSLHDTEKTQQVFGMIESLGGFRDESIG